MIMQFRRLHWQQEPEAYSIKAGVNYVSLSDLEKSKEGLANPLQGQVLAVDKPLKDIASKTEVDDYLVRPFLHKSDCL